MIGTTSPAHQRFPAFLALTLVATACGGGGGGSSPNAPPVIVTASFVGAGQNPVAGDTLLLTFTKPVTLTANTTLTDSDVALSGGGSLGLVTAAPAQLGTNTLSLVLGSGVSLVADVTTIALASTNDIVRDTSGALGTGGNPVPIGSSDGAAPAISRITIAAIDGELNGTGDAGGVLQVPQNGWTLDLTYADNSPIATAQTTITASVSVATAAGSQPPGTDLRPFLTAVSATNTGASYRVPATVTFPNGALTLTGIVVDVSGLASSPATFAATVRAFTDARRPFETVVNPRQTWYLDFTRDVEAYTTTALTVGVRVDVVAGANGRSDFEDLLRVLGLNSATPIANVQGGLDSNQIVQRDFKTALLQQLATMFSGANIEFTIAQPSGSFGGNSSVPYSSLGFSQISIAGAANVTGALGIAIFNPSNTTQDDNTLIDYANTRLGIFLHTIINAGMRSSASSTFRSIFDDLAPAQGGTPIGADADDDDRLLGTNTDARRDTIVAAIAALARYTAVITAHECGHSMGLVENGAMPVGLYGNDSTNFPDSADGHIRNTSLFPSGATNIMSPSLSFDETLDAATAFNSLNLAYLREQVYYGN